MIKVDIILPKICERVKSYSPIDFFAQNVVGQIYFSIASEFTICQEFSLVVLFIRNNL